MHLVGFTIEIYIEILQKFVNQCTDVKYCVLKMHGLKDILKY